MAAWCDCVAAVASVEVWGLAHCTATTAQPELQTDVWAALAARLAGPDCATTSLTLASPDCVTPGRSPAGLAATVAAVQQVTLAGLLLDAAGWDCVAAALAGADSKLARLELGPMLGMTEEVVGAVARAACRAPHLCLADPTSLPHLLPALQSALAGQGSLTTQLEVRGGRLTSETAPALGRCLAAATTARLESVRMDGQLAVLLTALESPSPALTSLAMLDCWLTEQELQVVANLAWCRFETMPGFHLNNNNLNLVMCENT